MGRHYFLSVRKFKFNIIKKFLIKNFIGLDLKLTVIFPIFP
jgi:hypothetical protein